MTICPIAMAVGCSKCPTVKFCPLKSVLGDYKEEEKASSEKNSKKKSGK